MKAVITGIGAMTAAGRGVARFTIAADGHGDHLGRAPRFAADGLPLYQVGAVPDVALGGDAADDRAVRIALPALVEALGASGLARDDLAALVADFSIGTSLGGMESACVLHEHVARTGGLDGVARERIEQAGYHGPAATLARRLGLDCAASTYNSTCSSGLTGLQLARLRIEQGEIDLAVVGAVDALSRFAYAGFHCLNALTEEEVAPYDPASRGMTLAEGAAFVVLESTASARRRGVAPLAVISGGSSSLDGFHPIAPHPEGRGLRDSLRRSLLEAGSTAADLALLIGHGIGTNSADRAELQCVASFPDFARDRLYSWKARLGHPLAAAGLLSVIRGVVALRKNELPEGMVSDGPVRRVAILSAGIGGQAAAMVLDSAPSRSAPSRSAAPLFAAARAAPPPPRKPTERTATLSLKAAVVVRVADGDPSFDGIAIQSEAFSPRHLPLEGRLAARAIHDLLRTVALPLPVGDGVALVGGVGFGSMECCARFHRALVDGRAAEASPAIFTYTAANAVGAALACTFGLTGPNVTAASGALASVQALLDAELLIRAGRVERAIVYGFSSPEDESGPVHAALGHTIAEPFAAALMLGPGGEEGEEIRVTLRGADAAARRTRGDRPKLSADRCAAALRFLADRPGQGAFELTDCQDGRSARVSVVSATRALPSR